MDGLIPFIFKVFKKKKAMKYYRSLSSGPAHIDVAELARQDYLFMTPQHPRAPRWHEGDDEPGAAPTAMTMTPLRERAKSGNAQRLAVMEVQPRETFSPRKHKAATAMGRGSGKSYLGGK